MLYSGLAKTRVFFKPNLGGVFLGFIGFY
jgi:hypothetical protein